MNDIDLGLNQISKKKQKTNVYIFGEINDDLVKNSLPIILNADEYSDIMIYIDSYGGDVDSCMTLYNVIKGSMANIHTICLNL